MTEQNKNNTAWEKLFVERNILDDINKKGVHNIKASDINKYREARLMAKFDHKINLPKFFSQNKLAILPDSRSSYVIGRFDCYAELPDASNDNIVEGSFPDWMQSLASNNISSESAAVLCAYHAGLISDVIEEAVDFTIFGRMSTGEFDFSINSFSEFGSVTKQPINVDKAQCEIDGGFEGVGKFAILEVKNEQVKDFHIRQLYYPYRLWSKKVSKAVVPVFLTYSNEVFTFRVYDFEDQNDYNSIRLIRTKRFQIVPTEIEIADIRHCLAKTQVKPEDPNIPFPQADSFERLIDLLTRLKANGGTITQDEITTNYAFDIRQTQYYTNAGRYLGLIEWSRDSESGVYYKFTELGIQLMNKVPSARNLALIELILTHAVFRETINFYFSNARSPKPPEVVDIMKRVALEKLNETTMGRRAQTVVAWAKWIIGLTAGL
jgi:hypothetical protein